MISLSDITSFDVIVVLIFLLFVIRGTWIGFMRQLAIFLGLIGSYLMAGTYTGLLMPHVSKFIENPKVVFYISFAVLFIMGSVFMILTGKVLRLVMEVTMTPWFDRTLGLLLGVAKGFFITSILYMAMSSSLVSSSELLQKSLTSPYLAQGSEMILRAIGDKELRTLFQPKKPAIVDELKEMIPDVDIEMPPVFNPENASQEIEE